MQDVAGYYAVLYPEPGSGTVGVEFPDHPNIITYGRDWDHAAEMAGEAMNAVLDSELDRNLPLPKPSPAPRAKRGQRIIFVPLAPEIRAAWMLRAWREQAGLTQARLARRLGITTQSYQRMERPGRANLTLATLDRIARALGKRLVVNLR
jgi:antitoxin HicB